LQADKTLDNYLYRYLGRSNEHKRTVVFLRLLRIVIREDLDKKRIVRMAEKHSRSFASHALSSHVEPFEIVPYEQLWSALLGAL
jgi:hypothetical protein